MRTLPLLFLLICTTVLAFDDLSDDADLGGMPQTISLRAASPMRWGKRVLRWGKRSPLRWGKREDEEEGVLDNQEEEEFQIKRQALRKMLRDAQIE